MIDAALLDESKCYLCLGVSIPEALKLVLLSRIADAAGQVTDYNNRLVYIQTDGTTTIIENPTGIIDLSATAPPITEIHSHNAPNLLAIIASNQTSLVEFDIQNLATFIGFILDGCTALPSVDLTGFTSLTVINLNGCTSLASLVLPNLATCGSVDLSASGLTTLSAPALTGLSGVFQMSLMPNLLSISLPVLDTAAAILIDNNALLTSVNMALLTAASGTIGIHTNASLAGISLPNLTTTGTNPVDFHDNSSATAIDLSSMAAAGFDSLDISGCSVLASMSLPAWTGALPSITANNCGSLAAFTFGGAPPIFTDGSQYNFRGDALLEASVDFLIQAGTDATMTSGLIYVDAGTNAPPSAAGQAQAAALLLAGVDIQTN